MKQKSFPPLEDLETEVEGYSTWHIEDWKSLPERCHGPSFEVGDFSWRILLFPEGNRADHVSLYLEASAKGSAENVAAPATQEDAPPQKIQEVPESVGSDAEYTDDFDGSDHAQAGDALSDSENDWAVCAQFGLVMWNPDDPTVYHHSCAHHRFNPDETDWGFTRFYELRKLFSLQLGKDSPLIANNKVNISTYVRIIKDETGVLWHKFEKYDSKKVTGFVGLKNQGATCYLNSLLQSLYFTKVFRQAVYQIPTEGEKDTVPAALQRLFYLLNTSLHPVGTLPLTRSFGWDSADAFTQHDVQELNRVLMDKLEGKMKGTAVDGALNGIFVAQMKSYIRCVNVDFESSRVEDYWDIQLNVKGMRNVEESFKDYISVEMLEGENQYQAGNGLGLQDAKKGVVFESFPPVLHLQLKRYDYDFIRDMMIKINDRYEFPLEMDLSPYLDPELPKSDESWDYVLHGVLVHSGDLNAGHYYALIKPEENGSWFKFDDDRVTRATMKEVLEENFGGEAHSINSIQNPPARNLARLNYKRHSSAYMLVYIRKSRVNQVLMTGKDVVPDVVTERIKKEDEEELLRRKQREEQQYFVNIKVMTTSLFKQYHGFDLGNWDNLDEPGSAIVFSYRKTQSIADMAKFLSGELSIPLNKMRIWTMTGRQNKTIRLDSLLTLSSDKPVEVLLSNGMSRNTRELRLWVENDFDAANSMILPSHHSLPNFFNGNDELKEGQKVGERKDCIFLKYFDPHQQSLVGISSFLIDPREKVSKLAKSINELMHWPSDTQLRLLEEVKPGMIEELKPKMTFQECEISDGDIVCFEKVLSSQEAEAIQGYSTAVEYYDFLQWRVLVTFRPKHDEEEGYNSNDEEEPVTAGRNGSPEKGPSFDIWLSKKDTYDVMAEKVGKQLGVDPTHLQLFTTSLEGYTSHPIKNNAGATIQQLLMPPYVNRCSSVVLYEILGMSLAELENKKQITINWLTDGLSHEHKVKVLVSKTATIGDVIEVLKEKANIPENVLPRVKIWTAHNSRMSRMLMLNSPVASIVDTVKVYASVMTDEEYELVHLEPSDDKKLVYVVHFQKDSSRTHGIPFSFVLKKGEKLVDTKHRLQKAMGVYDKMFEQIRLAVLITDGYSTPQYIADKSDEDGQEVELFDVIGDGQCLGLDHVDKSARRMYGYQSAIFIKN